MAKRGRPTDYTPEAGDVVKRLGEEGASRAEMAAELGVSFQTMRNWEKAHPEFLESTTRAGQLAQAWWEKQGRLGIWETKFNAAAYRLQVMNRFPLDWRDKQELHVETSEVPDEELIETARQQANRIAALTASRNGNGNGTGSHD